MTVVIKFPAEEDTEITKKLARGQARIKLCSSWRKIATSSPRRVTCTRPLLILWLISICNQGRGAGPCNKCYYPLYSGESRSAIVRIHTRLNLNCLDYSKLQTCEEEGKIYWLSKNTGNFKQKLDGEFLLMKEKWICFERNVGGEVWHQGVHGRDQIKEK